MLKWVGGERVYEIERRREDPGNLVSPLLVVPFLLFGWESELGVDWEKGRGKSKIFRERARDQELGLLSTILDGSA